jgi:hypothetical protein
MLGLWFRRFSIVPLAALALCGCRQPRGKVEPWVWPGANRSNTFVFAQRGTRPEPAQRFVGAWEAEWFDVPATEPLPAYAHAGHRPLLLDLDHDGHLEIVTSPLGEPPAAILNWEGTPLSGRGRSGTDWSLLQSSSARIVADDSAGWVLLPESSRSRPGSGPLVVKLSRRMVTLEVVSEPAPPDSVRVLECRDIEDGRLLWRYEFGARPDLMAVADLDTDGKEELLFATYSGEPVAAASRPGGRDSCHCLALRDDGSLLWQRGFGAHRSIGCTAGVADLDRDGKSEVFVTVYSWLDDFGRLAVLDGRTGEVRAELPESGSSPVSYVSAGCADLDGDGRQELAVAACGRKAEVQLYRFEASRLKLTARAPLGTARDSGEVSACRLHGICDLDGDGKYELVLSRSLNRMICRDPLFYPSTFDSCSLLILAGDLKRRQEIKLPVRCQDVTFGDVIPGGNIELLVVTDRLRLYTTEQTDSMNHR